MKTAILIDGSFFYIKFKAKNKRHPTQEDVRKLIDETLKAPELQDSILFRAYYYDCYPFDEKVKHPLTKDEINYKETDVMHTDFPDPVVPAINRCGMLTKSAAMAEPATSRPNAIARGDRIFENASVSRIGRRRTIDACLLGTSMPTYD